MRNTERPMRQGGRQRILWLPDPGVCLHCPGLHWVLLLLSLITLCAAMAGSHGWTFGQ